jgi:hypothetical protein
LIEGNIISGDEFEEYDITDPVIASAIAAKIIIKDH